MCYTRAVLQLALSLLSQDVTNLASDRQRQEIGRWGHEEPLSGPSVGVRVTVFDEASEPRHASDNYSRSLPWVMKRSQH